MTEDLLSTAKQAAAAAAEIHRFYAKQGFSSSAKSEHYDMVTSADVDSEKAITEIIGSSYPDHTIIAEEGTYPESGSAYTWFVDPLDGTNNFYKGFPHYAVSIAVACNDRIIAAVVQNTARGDELFFAAEEGPAYHNAAPINVSKQELLTNAMLSTGFHYDRGVYMRKTLQAIEHFFGQGIIGIRRSGCAALDICYVAAGWVDGYWEHVLSPWDYAAGSLILAQAGGILTNFHGEDTNLQKGPVLAANPRLHPILSREISGIYEV